MPRWRVWCLAWLLAPALACTTIRADVDIAGITPDQLLAGAPLGVAAQPTAPIAQAADVLALSPEMQAFLAKHVSRNATPGLKLEELVAAIMGTNTFGVVYDNKTQTASETFRRRRGNCLSFSNMFVAMARHVGLHVEYQEVDVPPDWTFEKDTYVLNRHVNVLVDLGPQGRKVVDFNIGDFKSSYAMRRISDARALAHYYNNIGVDRMLEGDAASALACFRRALASVGEGEGPGPPPAAESRETGVPIVRGEASLLQPAASSGENGRGFSPAWTNLGTLYVRTGHSAYGKAAYLQALRVNDEDLVAMSDLARLYEQLGDRQRAAAYQKGVIHHRWLNPYYRYELARQAYDAKQYDVAIGHLKVAIRKRPKEDQFYFLLGLSYLQKGNVAAARRAFTRARDVASTDTLKRKYADQIDSLRGDEQGHR